MKESKISDYEEYIDSKAYLSLRPGNAADDVIYFPVDIKDIRISFGKHHFLIVPHLVQNLGLGTKWVEKKQLILKQDYLYSYLEKSIHKDLSQCLTPRIDTRDDDLSFRHKHYDYFFSSYPDCAKFQRGFFRLGKTLSKDVLYFPIQIQDGRKLFGHPQYRIVPFGTNISSWSTKERRDVGCIWVDKKALTMEHNLKFDGLQAHFDPFSSDNLRFANEDDENDLKTGEELITT